MEAPITNHQAPENTQAPTDERVFEVGEWVTYSHTSVRGSTINFSTRRAKVAQVGKNTLLLKVRGGFIRESKKEVRKIHERSALGDAVMGICKLVAESDGKASQ